MPITLADAPKNMPKRAREVYVGAFNGAFEGSCKDSGGRRDECSRRIAFSAIKKGFKKVGDDWVPKSAIVELSLTITKASLQEDGTMRWQAVCSTTDTDKTGENTSIALFQDWIQRAETGQSADWLPVPRMPFLGLSHYPSLDGFGEAGPTEKMYIDGKMFKAGGTFYPDTDHPLGRALFQAVRSERDLIMRGEGPEQPIRISAAWWDISHSHGGFVFERKSLNSRCPMCSRTSGDKTYLEGQLDHFASTRVPIHPDTALQLKEKSMATARKDDAESIVDKALAEELDEKTKDAQVGKSEAETEPPLVIKAEDKHPPDFKPKKKKKKGDEDEETEEKAMMGNPENRFIEFGGATTMQGAQEFIQAQDLKDQVFTNFDMFLGVVGNIKTNPEVDTVAAMTTAVKDFGDRVSRLKANLSDAVLFTPVVMEKGELIMSEETQTTPVATDPYEVLKLASEASMVSGNREASLKGIQAAMGAFAKSMQAKVDQATPADVGAMVADAITKSMTPIVEAMQLQVAKMGGSAQPPAVPQQKSFAPGQQPIINDPSGGGQPAVSPETGKPSPLTQMIRGTVGIQ